MSRPSSLCSRHPDIPRSGLEPEAGRKLPLTTSGLSLGLIGDVSGQRPEYEVEEPDPRHHRFASVELRLFSTAALACSRSGNRRTDLAILRFLLELGFCFMTGGLRATDQ
jgi:hypothetical protein